MQPSFTQEHFLTIFFVLSFSLTYTEESSKKVFFFIFVGIGFRIPAALLSFILDLRYLLVCCLGMLVQLVSKNRVE